MSDRRVIGLLSRRFGTPRAAAFVLVILTGLAAFAIAAGPSALVTLTRVEAAHEVGLLSDSARNIDVGNSTIFPKQGPAAGGADSRLSPEISEAWGIVYEDIAGIRAAWPEDVQTIVGQGSAAMLSMLARAVAEDLADDAPLSDIRLLGDPEWDQHIRIKEGRLPAASSTSRILPDDPEWNEDFQSLLDMTPPGEDPWEWSPYLWRIDSIEIVLVADAAERMQWEIGEARAWQTGGSGGGGGFAFTGDLVLVGTVELTDPDALIWDEVPYVSPAELYDDGNNRPRLTAAAFVAPESFWDVTTLIRHRNQFYMWYPADATLVPQLDTSQLLKGLRAIEEQRAEVGGKDVRFYTATTAAVNMALARADSSAAVLGIALSGPVAVSIALIAVASGLILRRRVSADRLLVSRGMTLGRMRRLLLVEGLLLGLPVSIAGVALARWITPEDAGWVPDVAGLAIGFIPALALLGAAVDPLARTGRDSDLGASSARYGWLRLAWMGTVWGLAAGGATLMVMRGSASGMHPLVILTPVLVAAAVSMLAVRLYPWPIKAILSGAKKRRGPVSLVGAARTLRDPIVGGVAVLAIMVTVATVAFTATMITTIQRGAEGAAAQATGADLQVNGQIVNEDLLDRVGNVSAVAEMTSIAGVNGINLKAADNHTIRVLIVDPKQLAVVQEGLIDGFSPAYASLAADPAVDILLGPGLKAKIGEGPLTINGTPVRVAGELDTVLGMLLAGDWAVVSTDGYQRLSSDVAPARTLLIRLEDNIRQAANDGVLDASGQTVLERVKAEVAAAVDGAHSMTDYWIQQARIGDSPAVFSLRIALLIALALAVILAASAFMLVAGVTRDDRARSIALLSTLGTDRKQQLGIVSWEFVPIALAGLVAGGALGALIPWLTVTGVNLRPFTGGRLQPALSIDPVLMGGLGLASLAAIGLVILVEVQNARKVPVVEILRSEDHG